MIEDKQNILKSFQGKKIDQSVHVARWGTINNEDSNRNIFMKYAAGSSDTLQHQNSQEIIRHQNTYNTQQSQVHEIDTGFKKLKNNQIQMLKELKQEYDVLRNLNIQQKPSVKKINTKIHSSSSSLHHVDEPSEQILSTSSRQSKKKGTRKQNPTRQAQILSLQKKQLQIVINNSMRKIEQLLHAQMQYKKQIHELRLQASGRQNTDIEYQSMLKTLKKNQINQHENIQSLKKQNQKNRYQVRQLNQRISALQGEVIVKEQQIHRLYEQKRKSQDLIRLQKDRYFNLDIDYKKVKMEYQLLQKDKTNQINRLLRQSDYSSGNRIQSLQNKIKTYEQDIQIKDKRYNILLTQLQDLKRKYTQQQQEIHQLKNNPDLSLNKQKIQDILTNFRDQNDTVSFNRYMNQVLQKLHQMDHDQNEFLRQQIQMLKIQLDGLKDNDKQQNQMSIIQQYVQRIQQLDRNLRNQISQKEDLISRMRKFERQSQDVSRRNSQLQKQIQQFEQLQSKLREQIRTLKIKISQTSQTSQNAYRQSSYKQKTSELKVVKQIEALQRQTTQSINKYKFKIDQLQNQLRGMKRLADENQFKASKATTELQFRLRIQQNQHNSQLSRIGEDLERQRRQSQSLKQQYEKYRTVMEKKLSQRQAQIQSLRKIMRSTSDTSQSSINNVKHQYQSLLTTQRQRYKMQVQQLSTQIMSLTKINEKYLIESNKYIHYENQLSCLRQIMRRSIHLSEGVDHLWRIKETEYQNVNQVLRQISSWNY